MTQGCATERWSLDLHSKSPVLQTQRVEGMQLLGIEYHHSRWGSSTLGTFETGHLYLQVPPGIDPQSLTVGSRGGVP